MNDNKVNQRNIQAENVSARDINNFYQSPKTRMQIMLEKLKAQQADGLQTETIIDELQHFCSVVDANGFLGLSLKLQQGGWGEKEEEAEELKEHVTKRLIKFQNIEAAQEIYVYLLSNVYTKFKHKIYPLIKESATKAVINKAICDDIIAPISDLLDENTLHIFEREIEGFIYFLTGNCHLRWDC